MTQEPSREVETSVMDESQARALAATIAAAGYAVTVQRVTWGINPTSWYVSAETSLGWQAFFAETDWAHDPANPQRTEPPNW